ncbi:MAG: winged helix-turn-helix domain-containing protein [Elusimicrobiota bacterium]
MQLKKFRNVLLDTILTFLWKEWTTLGIPGGLRTEEKWILDPESLLAFSLPLARYEPRLFDEIINWLLTNGHWLDAARLRNILRKREAELIRVVGATIYSCAQNGDERKWKGLADFCWGVFKQQPKANSFSPLFMEKSGNPHPLASPKKADPYFMHFGFNRPQPKNLKNGNDVPSNSETNIRFLLRALYGVGGRSEFILYLLTHEGGRVRDIADEVGLFWLGVQQTLKDLAASGLIHTRKKGNKIEYWLSQKKWWEFLTPSISENQHNPKPQWVNWVSILSAVLTTWETIDQLSQKQSSDYIISSKQQDCLELISKNFMRAGLDVSPHTKNLSSIDQQQKTILEYLEKIST